MNTYTTEMMLKALRIAYDRMGNTSPNPAVGAVIVRNGRIISQEGTCPYGSHHAEVMAIKNAKGDLAGTDMFVTLEPCSHYGKTPPCVDAIIENKIKKVFIPVLDPNPLVSGKGVKRLAEAGVEVDFVPELASHAVDLIRPFRKYILRKRPFIINKSAVTLDGRIATDTGDSRWISSVYSRYLVHRLRAKVDAVIIGKNTQQNDDPALTVRLDTFNESVPVYFNEYSDTLRGKDNFFIYSLIKQEVTDFKQPLRVLVGIPDLLKKEAKILADDNYIIFEKKERIERFAADREKMDLMRTLNVIELDPVDNTDFVHLIMDELFKKGIMTAMLEGGGRLAGSFFDAGEIDQFMYFIAPRIAGNGIPPVQGKGKSLMEDSLYLKDISSAMIGDDILYGGYREMYNFEMM